MKVTPLEQHPMVAESVKIHASFAVAAPKGEDIAHPAAVVGPSKVPSVVSISKQVMGVKVNRMA